MFVGSSKQIPGYSVASVRLRILDRKSTRLNSSHSQISYAVFCLKKNIDYNLAATSPLPPLSVAPLDRARQLLPYHSPRDQPYLQDAAAATHAMRVGAGRLPRIS